MRLLLDTHAMLWAVEKNPKLTPAAQAALVDPANDRFLSAAAYWEIAIKVSVGKLTLAEPYLQFIQRAIQDLVLAILPITTDHAALVSGLPFHHRDPFDRMLVAQALTEPMPIVSGDPSLDAYGITRLW